MIDLLETNNIGDDMDTINANFTEAAEHAADTAIHTTTAEKETWDETGADLTGHMTNTNNPHGTTAAQVPYSNTSSGMAAETVQAALDEGIDKANAAIPASEKGAAGGVAELDANGKIKAQNLPSSVMEYQGTWNADTNTPTLADGTGDAGDIYRVSTAGTQTFGGVTYEFNVGEYAMYNGTVWEKSGADTYTKAEIDQLLAGKSSTDHTHPYAGADTPGGAATSANKINNPAISGSISTQGWYRIFTKLGTGIQGASLVFSVSTTYQNTANISAIITINYCNGEPSISVDCSNNLYGVISKIRVVYRLGYDGAYVDFLYQKSFTNAVNVAKLLCGGIMADCWQIAPSFATGTVPSGYSTVEQTINPSGITADNFYGAVCTAQVPATASSDGTAGSIAYDADYVYVCTAENTWKRAAIATW